MRGRQSTVQSAVRHTDLVVNHPQGRDGDTALVVVEVVREVLHLGLGNSVHRYRTLQRRDDLALGDHLVQVQSLRQSHRSLHSNFTERVTFVYQVQLVVIDSNVVEIICDNVNGDCVVDDSIDAKAVVSYILPLTGSNITNRKIGVDLLVVVECCSTQYN